MKWSVVDEYTDRVILGSEARIAGYYAGALENIDSELKTLSQRGLLNQQDMLMYNRLLKVEEQITEEMMRVTHASKRELKRTLGKAYEGTFNRTAFKLEKELQRRLAYSALNPDLVNQVINNPMDRVGWLKRAGSNQAKLTEQLKQELFNGLSAGKGYEEISEIIKERMDTGAENMNRIVRTEGHRCREQGKLDSMIHAERKGMIAEKQWLAGRDSRVRPSHGKVDTNKVPINGEFILDSGPSQGPGLSGFAKEDINCRCTMITIIKGFEPKDQRLGDGSVVPFDSFKAWELEMKKRAQAQAVADAIAKGGNASYNPDTLAGVKQGKEMTIKEARGRYNTLGWVEEPTANPYYITDRSYQINCQTTVVAHEARHRGYTIIAKGNTSGSKLERLSRDTTLAWIDPKTGKHPALEALKTATTPKKTYKALQTRLIEGERYTMELYWKRGGGHIVHVGKEKGKVFLFDPQNGSLITDQVRLEEYFKRLKYSFKSYDLKIPMPPKILRVDDKLFDLSMVNDILQKAPKNLRTS